MPSHPLNHVTSAQAFTRQYIDEVFSIADQLDSHTDRPLDGRSMASLFYEPSTRTRFSFESAMLKLGGSVMTTENARDFSSSAKGETLTDIIRMMNYYADVVVLRHPQAGISEQVASVASVPIINAGDGAGEHPTQALLDLYTIKKEVGTISGITVALVGDLKHGRTIRSLAYVLGKYENIQLVFVSPELLRVGTDVKVYLDAQGVAYEETADLNAVVERADVVYMTRVQEERFETAAAYMEMRDSYCMSRNLADRMKPGAILMHPLPRLGELPIEVDTSPHAVYFKQAQYGLRVRMALLQSLLL